MNGKQLYWMNASMYAIYHSYCYYAHIACVCNFFLFFFSCVIKILTSKWGFSTGLCVGLPIVDSSKASQDYVLKVEPMLRLKELGSVSSYVLFPALRHACVVYKRTYSLGKENQRKHGTLSLEIFIMMKIMRSSLSWYVFIIPNAIDKWLYPVFTKNLLKQGINGCREADLYMDGGSWDDKVFIYCLCDTYSLGLDILCFLIDLSNLFPIWTFEGCCNIYTQAISI